MAAIDRLTSKTWGHSAAVVILKQEVERLQNSVNDQLKAEDINIPAIKATLLVLGKYHTALGRHYKTQAQN